MNNKRVMSLIMAFVVAFSVALPTFAFTEKSSIPITVNIYKDDTYPPAAGETAPHSMAQNAIISASLDGNELTINTKYFRFFGLWGTMKQMRYERHTTGTLAYSTVNTAPVHDNGSIRITLDSAVVQAINNNETVELNNCEVKSTVVLFGHAMGDFKAVDFVINK